MESKKLYFYDIGYFSYEDSRYTALCHELLFTKEEFDELCVEAAVGAIRAWIQAPLFVDDETPRSDTDLPPDGTVSLFEDLSRVLPEYLIRHRGFTPIQYSERFYLSGWDSIFPESLDSGGFLYSDCNKAITLRLLSEGLAEPVENRNSKIREYWDSFDEAFHKEESARLAAEGLAEPVPERNLREEEEEDHGRDEQ